MSNESNTVTRAAVVRNPLGMHLRAAGKLVQLAGRFSSDIILVRDTTHANAKSIMSVLALAAAEGVELQLKAEGHDAEEAVATIADFIENDRGGAHATPSAES